VSIFFRGDLRLADPCPWGMPPLRLGTYMLLGCGLLLAPATGQRLLPGSENRSLLVVTTVGTWNPTFQEMLSLMVGSLKRYVFPAPDVAVIGHHSWARANLSAIAFPVLLSDRQFFDVPMAYMQSQASANKLRLFHLIPQIHQYDVVAVIDADVVVMWDFMALLGPLEPDTLYVRREAPVPRWQWAVRPRTYTAAEQRFLDQKRLTTFNAGQFVFRPSKEMKRLINHAYHLYHDHWRDSLYEQGHLNAVFLLHGRLSYRLTHLVCLFAHGLNATESMDCAVLHYCAQRMASSHKLERMRVAWNTRLALPPADPLRPAVLAALLRRLATPPIAPADPIDALRPLRLTPRQPIPAAIHMCAVGFSTGHPAAVVLFDSPRAAVSIFDPNPHSAESAARHLVLNSTFPDPHAVEYIPGPLSGTLSAHLAAVANRTARGCDIVAVEIPDLAVAEWLTYAAHPGALVLLSRCHVPPAAKLWRRLVAAGLKPLAPDPANPTPWWCFARFLPTPST